MFDTGGSVMPVRSGGSRSPSRIAPGRRPARPQGRWRRRDRRARAGVRVLAGGAGGIEHAHLKSFAQVVFLALNGLTVESQRSWQFTDHSAKGDLGHQLNGDGSRERSGVATPRTHRIRPYASPPVGWTSTCSPAMPCRGEPPPLGAQLLGYSYNVTQRHARIATQPCADPVSPSTLHRQPK